ncbi:hypothetical protein HU200_061456 [Digitaria exilis]|uniref:NADPH oxidase n=1 Tax=Digitaria exilis TaxID=1010633 RepID=A0A835E1D9_9POAL|nr:hypothetical protein HU200_061456 [Digitaria exilis]
MPSSNSNHLAGDDDDSSDAVVVAPAKKWRSSALLSAPSRAIRQLVPRELRRATSFHHRRRVGSGADDDGSTTAAARALDGLRFIGATRWEDVATRFDVLTADQGGVLYRAQFGQCIADNKPDFAGELFDALNRGRTQPAGDGISKDEMREFWTQINSASFDSRLQTFFDMVDKNGDGMISEEEIREMIILSASENKLSLIRDHAEEYARVIMEALDPDNLGFIALHNVESLLLRQRRRSSLSRSRTTTRIAAETAAPPTPPPEPKLLLLLRQAAYFLEDNWRRVWVMLLWLSICAVLFAWKFIQYQHRHDVFQVMGYCVCVAKGAAETLKFNMALVLLPVCRNTITWILNHTTATSVIPLAADSLNFHKVIAVAIAGAAALHAISHLACDFPRLLHATDAEYHPLGQRYFGFPRPDTYWWFVKGTEGWTGLVMVAIMAAAFTLATPWLRRRRGRWLPELVKKVAGFNAFWYAHHCFVAVYALLLVHGQFLYMTREWYKKTTWMYLAVPMAVYAGERLTRAVRSRVRPAKVIGADVYPGNVLSLRFDVESPPHGRRFRYKSGQYVFLNCAAVSPFEWHPFSITSAPQDDYVSVHIRDAGDWTHKLKEIFEKAKNKEPTGQLPTENNGHETAMTNPNWPKVRIDGPYGAPAQDYKQYDVVLLVGMGIGATPMISIIKDILNNMKHHLNASGDVEVGTASVSGTGTTAPSSSSSFRTRRAYFYWVTREQGTFDWFHKVMDEVVEADMEGVIELHNHCTTVYEEGDARSILISMLQSISQAKDGIDVVSGTRVRTHFGRPNWPRVYRRIADTHRHQRVGVFYCGNQVLTKELRELAQDFSRNSSTKFEFHKEIF